MTIEETIEKAIKGGWRVDLVDKHYFSVDKKGVWYALGGNTTVHITEFEIMLDPYFWKALGKELGWTDKYTRARTSPIIERNYTVTGWLTMWKKLIDYLAEGGTVEGYFKEL